MEFGFNISYRIVSYLICVATLFVIFKQSKSFADKWQPGNLTKNRDNASLYHSNYVLNFCATYEVKNADNATAVRWFEITFANSIQQRVFQRGQQMTITLPTSNYFVYLPGK